MRMAREIDTNTYEILNLHDGNHDPSFLKLSSKFRTQTGNRAIFHIGQLPREQKPPRCRHLRAYPYARYSQICHD